MSLQGVDWFVRSLLRAGVQPTLRPYVWSNVLGGGWVHIGKNAHCADF